MRMLAPLPRLAVLFTVFIGVGCEGAAPTGPAEGPAALVPAELSAAARSGVSQRYDVSGTIWSECLDEQVLVTGTLTQVFSRHYDSGGGYHWLSNYALHGTAVGLTSGNKYIYTEIHNMKENGDLPFNGLFDDTGAYYFTMSFVSPLISRGSAPNEIFQWDIRFKMDAAGNVTMDYLRQEIVCRG